MKKILFFPAVFLFTATLAQAETLKFAWQANPVEDQITGYKLYMDCGGPACVVADISSATTISILAPAGKAPHTFSLTAYRVEEDLTVTESWHSAYAIYNPKPGLVTPVKVFSMGVIK